MAARLPSQWLRLQPRKTRRPVKADVKAVARVAANRGVMAAVVIAEANAVKVQPAKSAPPAKVDAEALTHAQKRVRMAASKGVKAKPVRHVVTVQSVVNAKSVPFAKAAGTVARNVQTSNPKAAPMASQS